MTTFIIPEFIQHFFSQIILYMIIYIKLGFSFHDSMIQVEKKNQDSRLAKRLPSFNYRSIRRDEVEKVMGNLGIIYNTEDENFPKCLSCNDLLNMFDEEQPRLDEVKVAFDVFDENKDGYIDASELQRVVSALGLMDKVDMDDCKKMIRVYDNNSDGRIDFVEFVKFMEGTYC